MSVPPDIGAQVRQVLRRHLPLLPKDQEIKSDAELDKLGLDSVAVMNLIVDLEQTFGIVMPDELLQMETFQTQATIEAGLRKVLQQ